MTNFIDCLKQAITLATAEAKAIGAKNPDATMNDLRAEMDRIKNIYKEKGLEIKDKEAFNIATEENYKKLRQMHARVNAANKISKMEKVFQAKVDQKIADGVPPDVAELDAQTEILNELDERLAKKILGELNHTDAITRVDGIFKTNLSSLDAFSSLFDRSLGTDGKNQSISLKSRMNYNQELVAGMVRGLEQFSPTLVPGKAYDKKALSLNPDGQEQMLQWLIEGKGSNKEFGEVAKNVRAAYDMLHEKINKLGVNLGFLKNYVPNPTIVRGRLIDLARVEINNKQLASKGKKLSLSDIRKLKPGELRNMARNVLEDKMLPGLDLEKMLDFETGKPISVEKATALIHNYADLILDGFVDGKKDFELAMRGALPDAFQDGPGRSKYLQRVFHYKTAADWRGVHDSLGEGSMMGTVLGGLNGLTNDLSSYETFGPDPKQVVDYALSLYQQKRLTEGKSNALFPKENMAEWAYDLIGWRNNDHDGGVKVWQVVRNYLAATKFGSSVMYAVTDAINMAAWGKQFGVNYNQFIKNSFGVLPGQLKPANRQALINSHAQISQIINQSHNVLYQTADKSKLGGADWLWDSMIGGLNRFDKTNRWILRSTGLEYQTQFGITSFKNASYNHFAAVQDKPWVKLSPANKKWFKLYGIEPSDWNKIRAAKPMVYDEGFGKAKFLDENSLRAHGVDNDSVMKYYQMIDDEARRAMNLPNNLITQGGLGIGNTGIASLIGKSSVQGRNFAIANYFNNAHRILFDKTFAGWPDRVKFALTSATLMTMGGMMVITIGDLLNGRDPRERVKKTGDFIKAAYFKSAGLGVVLDLAKASMQAAEGGFQGGGIGSILGSTASDAAELAGYATKRVGKAVFGKTEFGKDIKTDNFQLIERMRRLSPLNSTWWAKYAHESIFMAMQDFFDTNADQKRARQEGNRQKRGTPPKFDKDGIFSFFD